MTIFVLYLNPITANAERYIPVVSAPTAEKLQDLLEGELCADYKEPGINSNGDNVVFSKCFKKGGLLENFNAPTLNGKNCFDVNEGIIECVSREDIVQQHLAELSMYDNHFLNVPSI